MARRRLETDRFFTSYYNATYYTQWGLDYIDNNWMKQILIRHYHSLATVLEHVNNTFVPWNTQNQP